MLGWLGFCAKVVEFILTKAAGRTIDLSLDRKHRAAKGLLQLYSTLEESTAVLGQLCIIFDKAVERRKPVIFSKDLVPFENRITYLTEDFARHYSELIDAIYIFDSRLGHLLRDVQGFKVQSLTAFGALLRKARFTIEFGGLHPFKKVSFSMFDDQIADINLDEIVEASKFENCQSGDVPERAPNKLVDALSVLLVEDEFTASDFEKVHYLRDRLRKQAALLEKTLPMLRDFIASNFTISDLLGYRKPRRTNEEIELDLNI
jgi:hypothetical protein